MFISLASRVAILLAVCTGCGGVEGSADGGEPDGGVDGGADGGSLITAPDIPWLADGVPPIMLAPCPDGWREVTGGEVMECDPYPEGGPATCAVGEAHFPGEGGCRPIGDPCPSGDYATTLPSGGTVIYAKVGAPARGDGSLGSPYSGLSEVPWSTLSAGTTVALAKGSYDGILPLRADVRVVGACAAETVLTGLADPVPAVVTVASAGAAAELRNVRITGAPEAGVRIERARRISLRGVLIDGATEFGILALGRGAEVELEDVVVRGTEPRGGLFGRGIDVEGGARLTASRLVIAGNSDMGLFAGQSGTEITLADVVVRDTEARALDGFGGWGIDVEAGARFVAAHLLVSGNRGLGLIAAGEGTVVSLTDVIVASTRPRAVDDTLGRAFSVEDGARVDAERLLVADNRDIGVLIIDDGSVMTLADVVVRDTKPQASDGISGRGFSVEVGGRLEATRLLIIRNREMGIFAGVDRVAVSLTDTAIRDTLPQDSDGLFGRALDVQDASSLDAMRLFAADNHDVGIYVATEGTVASLTDVIVRDTRSSEGPNSLGRGISVEDAARIDGDRVRVVGAEEVGLLAISNAEVDLRNVEISNVTRRSCVPGPCPMAPYGYAAVALASTLRLSRFELREAAVCGILLASMSGSDEAPVVDLEMGVVSNSAIGACVQVEGYDLERLTTGVQYRDNGSNLDTTMLPVPMPAAAP